MQKILESFGEFSQAELQLFSRMLKTRHRYKNEILLHPGDISQSVFFIMKGSFYQYYTCREKDENMITDLYMENDWFCNTESLLNQVPSKSAIVCFADAEIAELTLECIHQLIAFSQNFLKLNKIFNLV